jgi:hypothetical protein
VNEACRVIPLTGKPAASCKRQGGVIARIIFAGILRCFGKGIILFVFSDHKAGWPKPVL